MPPASQLSGNPFSLLLHYGFWGSGATDGSPEMLYVTLCSKYIYIVLCNPGLRGDLELIIQLLDKIHFGPSLPPSRESCGR